jgi:hypothetical protein
MTKRNAIISGVSAALFAMSVMNLSTLAQDRGPGGPPGGGERGGGGELPPWDQVSKDYEKVTTTPDGAFYGLYIDKKRNQLLAELPRGWENQKHYIAVTQASGGVFAGLQGPSRYVYWKRYDRRLALIEPQLETRSTGEIQSKNSVERLFTDRVLVDVPIVSTGPNGQPVIDLDDLFVSNGSTFIPMGGGGGGGRFGGAPTGGGVNARLLNIAKAKTFPQNTEVAIEVPTGGGSLTTFHYSISLMPDSTGYKPREADERVGYFMTVYRDLGQYDQEKKWTRYIERWHLEKRDPKLKLSPPKEPIVFYIEHTVPVRYRRWIRDGILYWNEAFRAVGLDNAIEVLYQDKETRTHMDKDPEDVRYNFIRWLNNDISTAIGPSRAHPLTGQIVDADIVLTDGWIRAYWGWYHEDAPELAIEGLSAETLTWLESFPQWDPRILLSSPEKQRRILAMREENKRRLAAGEIVEMPNDPALMMNEDLAAIAEWVEGDHKHCMAAHGLAFHMAFAHDVLDMLDMLEEPVAIEPADADAQAGDIAREPGDTLDGIPEWFVGPLLSELVCHEVGHTLGLRHNFKASSIYTLEQINSPEIKGKKPLAGSVMDYLPPNFYLPENKQGAVAAAHDEAKPADGEAKPAEGEAKPARAREKFDPDQLPGDFTMIGIGPYDKWAIEYGYTFDDPKKVLSRVAEPELAYLTDDDTEGPDPLARRYDFAADPYEYAANQMRIVGQQRANVLSKFVKEGQSWARARQGYERTLNMQMRVVSMLANWVGGSHVNRDRKGDPNGRPPTVVVDTEKQRQALQFVIDNTFNDASFGITPELIAHMTVDKWSDNSPGDRGDPTWPIHDRVMAIQASTLTMIMNPTTLKRVHDNEYRIAADQDALTLPELLQRMNDSIYTELDPSKLDGKTWTTRAPMISSLRRNLQSEMTDRLIYLSAEIADMPRALRTLATQHLRTLKGKLDALVSKSASGQIDEYTLAHLTDLKDRVDRALNTVQVTTPH